jgi:hypothetical protein
LFSIGGSAKTAGTQEPVLMDRCAASQAVPCLDSFGLDRDQLLITFMMPAANATDFHLNVRQGNLTVRYPCNVVENSSTSIYCTGPQIPLGTAIEIELYTQNGKLPLARGTFTINGIGLPNPGTAASALPALTLPASTALPSTTSPLKTPVPGTAYPNPGNNPNPNPNPIPNTNP